MNHNQEEIDRHGAEIGQAIEDVIKKHVAEGMPAANAFGAALGAIVYMSMVAGSTRKRLLRHVDYMVEFFKKNPPKPPVAEQPHN